MAGRKRHSAEDIVRKLRRADELAAEGKTGEEIAAELGVSAATLYNWRRAYGGMDTDAAKELKELREQNGRLKRLLAEAELEIDRPQHVRSIRLDLRDRRDTGPLTRTADPHLQPLLAPQPVDLLLVDLTALVIAQRRPSTPEPMARVFGGVRPQP